MDSADFQKLWASAVEQYVGLSSHAQIDLGRVENVEQLCLAMGEEEQRFADFRGKRKTALAASLRAVLTQVDVLDRVADLGKNIAFPPCQVVSYCVVQLLQTARKQSQDYDSVQDFFWSVRQYLLRLNLDPSLVGTDGPLRAVTLEILVCLLELCGLVTKLIKQGRLKKYFSTLASGTDPKLTEGLKKLEKLVEEESRLVARSTFSSTHHIENTIERLARDSAVSFKSQQAELSNLHADLLARLDQQDTKHSTVTNTLNISMTYSPFEDPHGIFRDSQLLHASIDEFGRLRDMRLQNTCEWIFQTTQYQDWIRSDSQLLWIQGLPGIGKSVLAARIVDQLSTLATPNYLVCYHFCRRRGDEMSTLDLVLQSFARQLVLQNPPILQEFITATKDQHGILKPPTPFWRTLLQALESSLQQKAVSWVIDGYDELSQQDRSGLCKFLNDIPKSIRVLIISRPLSNIFTSAAPKLEVQTFRVQKEHVADDIRKYISARVAKSKTLCNIEDQGHLKLDLQVRSDGMFLWAEVMLDQLERALTRAHLDKLTKSSPPSISKLYQQIFDELAVAFSESDSVGAEMIGYAVSFVWQARCPLSVDQLREAMEGQFGEIFNFRPTLEDLTGSLLKFHRSREVEYVHLLHGSLAEYLAKNEVNLSGIDCISTQTSHQLIAARCIESLSKEEPACAFDDYAGVHWIRHLLDALPLGPNILWKEHLRNLLNRPESIQKWIKAAPYDVFNQVQLLQSNLVRIFDQLDDQKISEPTREWYKSLLGKPSIISSLLAEQAGRLWLVEDVEKEQEIFLYFILRMELLQSIQPSLRLSGQERTNIGQKIYPKAVQTIAQGVLTEFSQGRRHDRIGQTLYMLRHYGEAEKEFQTAILSPSDDLERCHLHLAMTYRALGKLHKAAETLHQGIKKAEENSKANLVVSMLMTLAEIQDAMATSEERVLLLERAAKEAPDDHYVSELLADAHGAQRSPEQAMAIYQSIGAQSGQEKDFFGMSQMIQVTGSYDQAKTVYETSLLKYYDSSHWHRGFASVARKAHKVDELVLYYENAILESSSADPERAAAFCYWLGDAYYFEIGDQQKALTIWEDAVMTGTLGAEESRLRFALCEAYIDNGQYDKADAILEKNCDDEEQYICRSHLLFRGLSCARTDRPVEACEWFKKGFDLAIKRIEGLDDPNDNYGYQMLGKALMFLGLENDAERAFQQRIYTNTLQDSAGALHRAFCDVCYDSKGIRGTRFVCKSCYDIDLCQEHHEERLLGKLNLTRCKDDHLYLPIRPMEMTDLKTRSAASLAPDADWIRALQFKVHGGEPKVYTRVSESADKRPRDSSLSPPVHYLRSRRSLLLGFLFLILSLLFTFSLGWMKIICTRPSTTLLLYFFPNSSCN